MMNHTRYIEKLVVLSTLKDKDTTLSSMLYIVCKASHNSEFSVSLHHYIISP